MLTISEWHELFKIFFGVFFITLTTLYILGTIAENKRLKSKLRAKKLIQVNPKVISNYNAFVKENTKNMTLYEIKEFKRNLNIELNRMILKGVR